MTFVSVITPTWQRHDVLLGRCVPSVQAQEWPHEHIIVSDGPDALLPFFQLPEHDPEKHWGHHARQRGLELARGKFIAYLDDDDEWESGHLQVLAEALEADEHAGFAFSRALVHMTDGSTVRIGDGRPAHGRVQTSMLMHRRWVLDTATWSHAHPAEDWLLVEAWLKAGIPYVSVPEVTVHYHPSAGIDPAQCSLVSLPPP